MKVLAIGATGFIGSYVARRLTEQGHDVAVLHRGTSVDIPADVQQIRGSRGALADVQPEVERFGPDVGYLRRLDAGIPGLLLAKEQAGWRWTRGYVENVAAAIALAVTDDRATNSVYNVGEKSAPTEREWIEEIGTAIGWRGEVVPVSAERLPEHLRQPFDFRYQLVTDTGRIRNELTYIEPVGRQEALKRTIEWERSQPGEPEADQVAYAAEREALAALRNAE